MLLTHTSNFPYGVLKMVEPLEDVGNAFSALAVKLSIQEDTFDVTR